MFASRSSVSQVLFIYTAEEWYLAHPNVGRNTFFWSQEFIRFRNTSLELLILSFKDTVQFGC